MSQLAAVLIGALCLGSAASAQYPAVVTTVTPSGGVITYNYRLTNSTPNDIWQFAVFMPGGAAQAITSSSTSQGGWRVLIRPAAFDMINWDWAGSSVIGPGDSADFSFTTEAGVPTTEAFGGATVSGSNWVWAYGVPDGGAVGEGNTILPVPVPEPASLLALCAGLVPLLLRRRRG